jgi:hypothetical protein
VSTKYPGVMAQEPSPRAHKPRVRFRIPPSAQPRAFSDKPTSRELTAMYYSIEEDGFVKTEIWIGTIEISWSDAEEVEDMLERTRNNPNAIIYGTFYSYPVM